jgi:hypothetical protein
MNPYYVAGGTLHPEAECYIERDADRELFDGLLRGEFCYVLTSRQMGKSSLMARTAWKLKKRGFEVVMIDLTAVGQNVTCEQWYDGLIMQVAEQLDLEDEVEDFWATQDRLSPIQRFIRTLTEVVLESIANNLVIFFDEIDTVQSLQFSADELFGAIRESYNRRTREEKFVRLDFCLIGVASPVDLIRDTNVSPFNAGTPIHLLDFTLQETEDLAQGLNDEQAQLWSISHQIYHWTQGHPYLTLRLYQAVSRLPVISGVDDVDKVCGDLFLQPQSITTDANLIFVNAWLLRSQVEQITQETLDLVKVFSLGEKVPYEPESALQKHILLSGLVTQKKGVLTIRNPIYQQVFNTAWMNRYRPKYYSSSTTEKPSRSTASQDQMPFWQVTVWGIASLALGIYFLYFRNGSDEQGISRDSRGPSSLVQESNSSSPNTSSSGSMEVLQGEHAEPDMPYVATDDEIIQMARGVWDLGGKIGTDYGLLDRSPALTRIEGDKHEVWFNHQNPLPSPNELSRIPNAHVIRHSNFDGSGLTDAHLASMKGWTNLMTIENDGSLITDSGLRLLSQFPQLLSFQIPRLTLESIEILSNTAPRLHYLTIWNSTITKEKIIHLNEMNILGLHLQNCVFDPNENFEGVKLSTLERFTIQNYSGNSYDVPHTLFKDLANVVEINLTNIRLDHEDFIALSQLKNLKTFIMYGYARFNEQDLLLMKDASLETLEFQLVDLPISDDVLNQLRASGIQTVNYRKEQ